MKLYLDDLRIPSQSGYIDAEWCIVRNYEQFRAIVDKIVPEEISFDHDLSDFNIDGTENTGKTCLMYFTGVIIPEMTTTIIRSHSANPVGRESILNYAKAFNIHGDGQLQIFDYRVINMGDSEE